MHNRLIEWFKGHWLTTLIITFSALVIGVGQLTDSIDKIIIFSKKYTNNEVKKTAEQKIVAELENVKVDEAITSNHLTIKIVLTWGSLPNDLDSHLTGPVDDRDLSRFHLQSTSQYKYLKTYKNILTPFASLDVDDTSSYGPETITIKKQYKGTYRYSVYDRSDNVSRDSKVLSMSGARVNLITPLYSKTFTVPHGIGNLWTVFELDGNRVTPINTLSFKHQENDIL